VRELSLADEVALDWLERWDAGNNPPKGRNGAGLVRKTIRRAKHHCHVIRFVVEV
jgi:hypothetical protein